MSSDKKERLVCPDCAKEYDKDRFEPSELSQIFAENHYLKDKLDEANQSIENLEKEKEGQRQILKHFGDSFFRQAFCAALSGLLANPTADDNLKWELEKGKSAYYLIANSARLYAQESVRQVGELNKPQCEKSPSGLHRYNGIDIGNGTCIYCDYKEQARDF